MEDKVMNKESSMAFYTLKSVAALLFILGLLLIVSALYGFFAEGPILMLIKSSLFGFAAYAVPVFIYNLTGSCMKVSLMTPGMVVLKLAYAVILKFLLMIIILGLSIKFIDLISGVLFISFVFTAVLYQLSSMLIWS